MLITIINDVYFENEGEENSKKKIKYNNLDNALWLIQMKTQQRDN